MSNKEPADATALLKGSMLLRKGRADVFRQRERTKLKRVVRAIVIVFLVDWYLFRRYSSGNPITLPSLPDEWIFLAFPLLILIPVMLMVALPLINGKSPHITVYPEQVEDGLHGFLVPPGDAAALADAVGAALALGATARAALGARARAHVERHFSLERMVSSTLDVYSALLEGRAGRRAS